MQSRRCVTRTCSGSLSRWRISGRWATCGARSGCTEGASSRYSADNILSMPTATTDLRGKVSFLQAELRRLGRVMVAYSGGVDSAYLAWAAYRELGNQMLAVICESHKLAWEQFHESGNLSR